MASQSTAVRSSAGGRASRSLVRLYEGRLAATPWGRFARLASVGIAVTCVLGVIALRVSDGPRASTQGVLRAAAGSALWLVGVTAALAASHRRGFADLRDGVDALALAHGARRGALFGLRAAASGLFVARWMLLPIVLTAVASLAASPSVATAGRRALALALTPLFALGAALALGGLGALCEEVAPRRGRSLLLAVLFLSAALAEAAHVRELSVIGALRALLAGLLGLTKGGASAWVGL